MHKALVCVTFFLLILFPVSLAYADRGLITVVPGISVYEPGQKAIIAWNGQNEVLILSTDVSSSNETLVLELLPLPSEPIVEPASFSCFEEIQRLIWDEGVNKFFYSTREQAQSESVQVVFHEQIGAHNITVVRAFSASELISWIESFLQTSNVSVSISLGNFESAVKDYMGRGFHYYVLDLITITPDVRSAEPIFYCFNTSFLYYPFVITSPVPGESEITLFLLTKGKVEKDYQPMQKKFYRTGVTLVPLKPIEFVLSNGELSRIDLRIGKLFEEGARLTVLYYSGKPSQFTRDLMIAEGAVNPDSAVNVEVVLPLSLVALCILLGAACTLAGIAFTFLVARPRKEAGETG